MKSILIIGATSAIAEQYARIQAAEGAAVFLVARSAERLQVIASDLKVRGASKCIWQVLDVNEFEHHQKCLQDAWTALGHVDIALIAHGTLPIQEMCQTDNAFAIREFSTNGTATIALMGLLAQKLVHQGKGTLAVISSVAGDRGRASNYLYGSAKAAVTAFASGLRQRLHSSGINVLTIKPGFVDTPMTRKFKKGPLWASPERVAKGITSAIDRQRSVVYLPGFWWMIMQIITHIPEFFFRRIRL